MEYPDILGYTLEDAIDILNLKNFSFDINYYKAPKDCNNKIDSQSAKVVRVKSLSEKHLELIVCDI